MGFAGLYVLWHVVAGIRYGISACIRKRKERAGHAESASGETLSDPEKQEWEQVELK
jgi:hypothetical protein